jgi:RimJ/RimL family protein N-acetyltransferase
MSFDHLFRSEHLVYRALENNAEDKSFYHNMLVNDPVGYAQSSNVLLKPPSLDDIAKRLETIPNSLLEVVVCLPPPENYVNAEPIPIGEISLYAPPNTRHHRSCTLGIMIAAPHQGKGYGTEAIKWALDWAFRAANMHVVRLGCFSFNPAARLYDRLGFVRDGVDRDFYYYDFKWYDGFRFSMLQSEWTSLQDSSKDILQVKK